MENIMNELQKVNSPKLSAMNKEMQMVYRNYTKIVIDIYDYAKSILDLALGENYSLPIDIRTVAEKLGFVISKEEDPEIVERYNVKNEFCFPISRLIMRKTMSGSENDLIR